MKNEKRKVKKYIKGGIRNEEKFKFNIIIDCGFDAF